MLKQLSHITYRDKTKCTFDDFKAPLLSLALDLQSIGGTIPCRKINHQIPYPNQTAKKFYTPCRSAGGKQNTKWRVQRLHYIELEVGTCEVFAIWFTVGNPVFKSSDLLPFLEKKIPLCTNNTGDPRNNYRRIWVGVPIPFRIPALEIQSGVFCLHYSIRARISEVKIPRFRG